MKILVLCYEYPPLGGGGGRVAQTVAKALAARGHEVRVHTGGMAHLPKRQEENGVEVIRIRSGRKREDRCSIPEMIAWCAAAALPTLRAIREWKPDVIHTHFAVPTGLLAWALHRFTGVPYVITAHLGDVPGAFFPRDSALFMALEPITGRIWREAARVTGVSSFVSEAGEEAYHRPVVMIPNGIDLSDAPPARPAPAGGKDRQLVFVGRLVEQKRPLLLLEALATIRSLPWRLTLIGDGPLMPEVKARVAALGLDDRVTLTGWQSAAEVHRTLGEADIFCMPSESEGLPVAAVEALKYGLAIAGTKIPGLRDVLSDQVNGLAVPVDDVPALARALSRLIVSEAFLTASKQASAEKAREFDLNRIAESYERTLHEAHVEWGGQRESAAPLCREKGGREREAKNLAPEENRLPPSRRSPYPPPTAKSGYRQIQIFTHRNTALPPKRRRARIGLAAALHKRPALCCCNDPPHTIVLLAMQLPGLAPPPFCHYPLPHDVRHRPTDRRRFCQFLEQSSAGIGLYP